MRNIYLTILFSLFIISCHSENGLESRFLAAPSAEVVVYELDKNNQLIAADTLIRGAEVMVNLSNTIEVNEMEYFSIFFEDRSYYVAAANTVSAHAEVVQEEQIIIRTPASIIDDTITSHICGLAQKDSAYEVIDYDSIFPDGNVHRYKIRDGENEGYIYAKYTTNYPLPAPFDAATVQAIHAQVRNRFGGGEAAGCDFYPVAKPAFEHNVMPRSAHSLYLNISPAVLGKIDEYIALAKQTKINTFVIDIKDNECPGYKADAMAKYSPTNYKWGDSRKADMYTYAVKRLHEEGFYVVGRITCFKDTYFIKDHPECAITERATGKPFFHNKAYWPSAYDRRVWQFNVELAKEAVRKFHFNEINFDYVRFPDKMQSIEASIDYHNQYNESKVQAIQRFVQYACDEIHAVGAYVSIDVFGEAAAKGYTTPYGQYWPAISNVADVICGMPYPDHFAPGYGGIAKPWNNPYKTLYVWGKSVQSRQEETTTPARVRTWIQAYPVLRYVDPNAIVYGATQIAEQIRGLYDAGLTDGYITWLATSSLERYKVLAPAFEIDYLATSPSQEESEEQ